MLKGKVLFVLVHRWMKWLLQRLCCLLIFQLKKPKSAICGMGSYSQDQFLPLYHTWSHFHSLSQSQIPQKIQLIHMYQTILQNTICICCWKLYCVELAVCFEQTWHLFSMFCNGSKRIKSSFPFVTPCFFSPIQIPFVLPRRTVSFWIWCLLTEQEHCSGNR